MDQKLKFEEGKAYRTRDGHKAVVKGIWEAAEFPVYGSVENIENGDHNTWTIDGKFYWSSEHDLDLVAEWVDEAAVPSFARTIDNLPSGTIIENLDDLAMMAHHMAVDKGFYNDEVSPAQQIALIHSEAREMLETFRKESEQSAQIPGFSTSEEEAADIIIRVLDMAGHRDMRIGQAIVAKMAYNSMRPAKHGKRF